MKYTKQELKDSNEYKNSTLVEAYRYMFNGHRLHTDFIEYIGSSNFDESELDTLPYDENGEVDVDIFLMEEEQYNSTILANGDVKWSDLYQDDDKICVIVVR